MKYVLIGTLLGSFLHSEHDSKELCMGRKAMLEEKGAIVKCVESPQGNLVYFNGSVICSAVTCR